MGIAKNTALVLGAAFVVAATLEATGYRIADREDGGNFLCDMDPACRALRPDEIRLAREVFGDEIDYKKVKVFSRPYLFLLGKGDESVTPNGNIYNLKDAVDGSSPAAIARQQHFLHEMTHVWQHRQGQNVQIEAARLWLKYDFNYSASYDYDIDRLSGFGALNIEQQARFVENYYKIRQEMAERSPILEIIEKGDPEYFKTARGEECRILTYYRDILVPVLPVKPEALCAPAKNLA